MQQENEELQKALQGAEKMLEAVMLEKEQAMAERDQLKTLYDNFRHHYDQIKMEVGTYQKRLGEEIQNRKEIELNLESRLNEQRR